MQSPPLKIGWLQKQGHFVKNWKRRYFVLEMGRLQYFEKKCPKEAPPYGINSKGCITMSNMDMLEPEVDEKNAEDANKIYLFDQVTGKDLLVSAADVIECLEWKNALKLHISFATQYPQLVLQAGDDSAEDETKRVSLQRTISIESGRSPSLSKAWGKEEDLAASSGAFSSSGGEAAEGGGIGVCVQPSPGFVIKTRRENGMKVD
jgi:hypothetical protein